MNKTIPIMNRELLGLLASPMGYIILAAYTFVVAFLFNTFLGGVMAALQEYPNGIAFLQQYMNSAVFNHIMLILVLIAPALTMRSIAEEKSTGTLQLLLTAPVRDTEVILGKFGAAFVFFLTIIAASIVFPLILQFSASSFNWGEILAAYAGLILMAAFFCAAGVFISSLVESQVVAAVLTLAFLVFGTWIVGISGKVFRGRMGAALEYFSLQGHFDPFLGGVIGTEHVVFFMSGTLLLLFLSVKSLEKRKWTSLLEDDISRRLFTFDPLWSGALFLWGLFVILLLFLPRYDRISMGLFALGCLLALAWIIRRRTLIHALLVSRRGVAGANVVISTVIVGVIFIIVSIANHRYGARWDITADRIKSLAPETRTVVQGLPAPCEIVVFEARHRLRAELELMTWFEEFRPKLTVTYLDPRANPREVDALCRGTEQATLEDYLVVLNRDTVARMKQAGQNPYKHACLVNLKNISSKTMLEEEVDLALLTVARGNAGAKKKVYVLTGHGEPRLDDASPGGLSQFAFLLEREYINYEILFLPGAGKVPGDCDLLVIIDPQHHTDPDSGLPVSLFAPEEVRIIRDYLDRERRNLLVCAGPGFSEIPFKAVQEELKATGAIADAALFVNSGGLLGLLAGEGFMLTGGLVCNMSRHMADDPAALFVEPQPGNEITQARPYQLVMPECTPLLIGRGGAVVPFLDMRDQTWIEDVIGADRKFDGQKENLCARGVLGALAYSRSAEGESDRRIVVIGSGRIATNRSIVVRNNREVLRDAVNWLLKKESFAISRNFTLVTIVMSETTRKAVFYISVLVLPFLFLGVAVLVWWDRR
ncbi:MAG: ABC transporter permease subunit [Planctomycetota bacterium]